MANNWTTAWIKGTGQEFEITPVIENIYISSLSEARKSNNEYHTVNMCDDSNNQKNENHFPVGEIVSHYGLWANSKALQIKNWRAGVEKTVELVKQGKKVLIHCHAGIHRSTLVTSASLTILYPSRFPTLAKAHEFVLSKRVIGWKKEDTFKLMEQIVSDIKTESK